MTDIKPTFCAPNICPRARTEGVERTSLHPLGYQGSSVMLTDPLDHANVSLKPRTFITSLISTGFAGRDRPP